MKVKCLIDRVGPKPMVKGEVYDLDEAEAERLVAHGKAEFVGKPKTKTEAAMKPPAKGRSRASSSKPSDRDTPGD